MRILTTILLMLGLGFLAPAQADNDWELVKEKDDIQVYTRLIDGSGLKEFRGITRIPTSLSSLVALIDDAPACVDWMHNCKEQRVLEHTQFEEKYTYNHVGAPWPVKDRDMVVQSLLKQDPSTHRIHIQLTAMADYLPAEKGKVRMSNMYGYWDLNPIEEGVVEVTYQVFADPAGKVPTAIINSTVIDSPFNTLKAMREKAQEEAYQTREFESIHNPW